MLKGIVLELVKKLNGTEIAYKDLPQNAKNSVDVYYRNEFCYDIKDDDVFGYVEIPMKELKAVIGCPDNLPYKTFEEYHKWYMDGGDIPSHKDVWAVILSSDDEIILDGWHRFHSYVEKDVKMVPCIYPIKVESLC